MARVRTLPTFRCPSAFVFWHPSRPHSRGLRTHRNSLLDQDRIVDRHVKDRMVWSDSLKSSTSALYVNPISIVYSRKPRRSIHDIDSWKWTSIEIQEYVESWCSTPPQSLRDLVKRQEMLQLHEKIILPSIISGSPFVRHKDNPSYLTYTTVSNECGSRIPITEFYTAMGWIVSMVESRGSRPLDYHRILATYAKWCHTVWRDAFPGTCVPTTASIKVVTPISRNGSVPDHRRSFWVSTSLPHANLKEQARLVREQYMHDVFGRLPDAPIFAEALKEGVDCGRVKWGHCAETLTTMCSYLRAPAPDLLCGVAIKLKPVAKAPEYSPLIFRNAMLEACDNCKMMMKHASIIYDDWHNQGRPTGT